MGFIRIAGAYGRLDGQDHHHRVALRYVVFCRHLAKCLYCRDVVVFDGTMIVLAMVTLNVFHPGFLLGKAETWLLRDSDEGVKTLRPDKESI